MRHTSGSDDKESTCSAGDCTVWFDPWVGKIAWEVHGNPPQYSCLENPRGQRRLAGCSPLGLKESDTTERLSTAQHSTWSTQEGLLSLIHLRILRNGFSAWYENVILSQYSFMLQAFPTFHNQNLFAKFCGKRGWFKGWNFSCCPICEVVRPN